MKHHGLIQTILSVWMYCVAYIISRDMPLLFHCLVSPISVHKETSSFSGDSVGDFLHAWPWSDRYVPFLIISIIGSLKYRTLAIVPVSVLSNALIPSQHFSSVTDQTSSSNTRGRHHPNDPWQCHTGKMLPCTTWKDWFEEKFLLTSIQSFQFD